MTSKGVTWIVNNLKPRVESNLHKLIGDDNDWRTINVHPSYQCPQEVTQRKCWSQSGIFYDYLIRREICILRRGRSAVARDNRADLFERALDEYEREESMELKVGGKRIRRRNIGKVKKFLRSYKVFQDSQQKSLDILKEIFETSMLHMVYFGRRTVSFRPELIDRENVRAVLNFVNTLDEQDLSAVEINPTVGGEFFMGDADLIFRDCIMDLKVSKYERNANTSYRLRFDRGIYQMLFYALGHFIKAGQEIKRFKIYNPLLGVIYVLNVPHLDFNKLRWMLDRKPCWQVN